MSGGAGRNEMAEKQGITRGMGERGRRQRNRTEGGGRGGASYAEDGKRNVKKRQMKIEMGKTGERNKELLLVLEG